MSFILSSDSCCDEFKSEINKHNIHLISMAYIINDIEYRDNFDSAAEYRAFYDLLRTGKMPKTTQLSPFETAEYFEKLLAENEGDIIHLSLSGGLSSTAANAKIAADEVMAKYPNRKIYAIDSKSATVGQLYLLDRARELRDAGESAEFVNEYILKLIDRLHHFLLVKDLFHLKRGGRVSPAAAIVGTVLGIHPIIVINHKGQLAVVDKERGATKSLKYAVKAMKKHKKEGTIKAYIAHADDIENAQDLKNMLIEEGITDVKIGYIGPIIGSHTGPGAIGLVFEGEKRITAEPQ